MQKIFCFLDFHRWNTSGQNRTCKCCQRKEVLFVDLDFNEQFWIRAD